MESPGRFLWLVFTLSSLNGFPSRNFYPSEWRRKDNGRVPGDYTLELQVGFNQFSLLYICIEGYWACFVEVKTSELNEKSEAHPHRVTIQAVNILAVGWTDYSFIQKWVWPMCNKENRTPDNCFWNPLSPFQFSICGKQFQAHFTLSWLILWNSFHDITQPHMKEAESILWWYTTSQCKRKLTTEMKRKGLTVIFG